MQHLERIGHVPHVLAHLVALGIEHKAGRNDILEGDRIEHHRRNGMEREEPAAGLVDPLIDKIGREESRWNGCSFVGGVYQFPAIFGFGLALGLQSFCIDLALERIMQLGIRHGTAVEPDIDKVCLPVHGSALLVYKNNLIHVRTVQINPVVILLTEVPHDESGFFQRIPVHHTGGDSLLYLIIKLLYRTDALLAAVLVTPDRQRSAPEA